MQRNLIITRGLRIPCCSFLFICLSWDSLQVMFVSLLRIFIFQTISHLIFPLYLLKVRHDLMLSLIRLYFSCFFFFFFFFFFLQSLAFCVCVCFFLNRHALYPLGSWGIDTSNRSYKNPIITVIGSSTSAGYSDPTVISSCFTHENTSFTLSYLISLITIFFFLFFFFVPT